MAFGSGGGSNPPRRPQALAPTAISAMSARAPALIVGWAGRDFGREITKRLRWRGVNIPKHPAEARGREKASRISAVRQWAVPQGLTGLCPLLPDFNY